MEAKDYNTKNILPESYAQLLLLAGRVGKWGGTASNI
jgi:hypothetical protein